MVPTADATSACTYMRAFARAPVGMALVGIDSRFLEVNDALCALAGRERDALVGAPLEVLCHPEELAADLALAERAVSGAQDIFTRVTRYLRPDGSACPVDVSGSLIRDDAGAPAHLLLHVNELTGGSGADHESAHGEASLRSAFDDALTGMVLTGPDGRVRRINSVACDLLGRRPVELEGVAVAEFTHPDDRDADAERVRAIVAGESDGGRWEKRYVRPAGQVVWVEVSTMLVRGSDASPLYFVTQVADIGDRKRVERVKDEFLATISHELRTPLTSINGYTDLLADDELSYAMRRNAVAAVQRNAQRLLRLIDDVQFIAQARAELLALREAPVQLHRIVGECVDWAAQRASEQEIELTFRAEQIQAEGGDAERLAQAVDHLLSNALTFTERGGRVDVRLSRSGDQALLEVADTGVGIAEADRPQLFEHFFRASSAVDGAVPGVGLGLAIVKAIVELHGGRVDVTSILGEGSVFAVRLPLGS